MGSVKLTGRPDTKTQNRTDTEQNRTEQNRQRWWHEGSVELTGRPDTKTQNRHRTDSGGGTSLRAVSSSLGGAFVSALRRSSGARRAVCSVVPTWPQVKKMER